MSAQRLTLLELNRATLARQGLLEPLHPASVADAVERVASLQAQHPAWPGFALRTRLPAGSPHGDLAAARARREVVRASLMRMTAHVVSAADFWPMRAVTRAFRLAQWGVLYRQDPHTSPLGRRILAVHPAAIAAMGERPLAIHEIEAILRRELGPKVEVPPNRALWRHFAAFVPLVHVPHDGETYGRSRYLPAEAWLGAPRDDPEDTDAAAVHVVERYLRAFGPASVEDVAAYIGRGRDMRRWRVAVDCLEPRLVRLVDEAGRAMIDLADAPRPDAAATAPPRLLARWDSLLLAYGTRHRTRVLDDARRAVVITKNADVLPTFLVDGVVAGTWLPRRDGAGQPYGELRPFGRLGAAHRAALEADAERLLAGMGAATYSRYPGTD